MFSRKWPPLDPPLKHCNMQVRIHVCCTFIFSILATDEDFILPSSVPLMFASGSRNGTEVCTNLVANADDEVECEEYFTVHLALLTPGSNLNLIDTVTDITIIDSNGILA